MSNDLVVNKNDLIEAIEDKSVSDIQMHRSFHKIRIGIYLVDY